MKIQIANNHLPIIVSFNPNVNNLNSSLANPTDTLSLSKQPTTNVCFECGKNSKEIGSLTQCNYYLHIKITSFTKEQQYYCTTGECAKKHYIINHQ